MDFDWMQMLKAGLGTLVALLVVVGLFVMFVRDITQKKHGGAAQLPGRSAGCATSSRSWASTSASISSPATARRCRSTARRARWVYRLAKNEGGIIGFGSTYDLHEPGALIFVNHPFPVLEEERLPTPSLMLGEGYCKHPFEARSIVNISGMSFGAISAPAVRSLSRGAAVAGCWMDTGEGGLSPYHLEGGCDIIMQIGTAKYGVRDAQGNLIAGAAASSCAKVVKAFEIKLSQGAKPGKGGVLPGEEGDRGDRADPRHPGRAATRSARTATATSPT